MSLFWKGAAGWPIPSKNMDNLEKNQRKFSELKFGTFIHFNSATIQFQVGNIVDWEFDCENFGVKRAFPFAEEMWNPAELDEDGKSGGMPVCSADGQTPRRILPLALCMDRALC